MTEAAHRDATRTGGTLDRMIRVIEGLVDVGAPVGPRALARLTGIDRSAVGRILQQLAALDVLSRQDGGYVPGPRLFTLTRVIAATDTFPSAANAVLTDLVDQFDETSYVCALHGDSVVFLYECQSSRPLRYVVELGKPVPVHAGAAGRAILAGLDEAGAAALLGSGPLPAITEGTITDPSRLLAMAARDRARGFTVSIEERVEGGIAVGAPFFDSSGRCQGSVVFTSPHSRFDEARSDEIGSAVAVAAATLSARLGAPAGSPVGGSR